MNFLDNIPENPETDHFVNKSFDIVDRIQYILKELGITQKELAVRLGKNESEISKWMSGMHNFTLRTITNIEHSLQQNIICVADPKAIPCESDSNYERYTNLMFGKFNTNSVECPECIPSESMFKFKFGDDSSFRNEKSEYQEIKFREVA